MSVFWLCVGIGIGVFIPAPYDAIAKNAMSKVWGWIRGS